MANWFARDASGATGWVAGDQTKVAGPAVTIAGTIPTLVGSMDIFAQAPTTLTASANILDSSSNPIPDGLKVIVLRDDGNTWSEVGEVTTSGGVGLVSYTDTMVPPHPSYIFVVPRQTGWQVETICTPTVIPV